MEHDLQTLKQNLERRGFDVHIADDRAAAVDVAANLVAGSASVSFPGSVTVREIGLKEKLEQMGISVVDIWEEGGREGRLKQVRAETIIGSTNAVSMDGFLVNLDGSGNRVASYSFGPRKVVLLVGVNKITAGLEDAVSRVRNVAAPLNYQRKSVDTPCARTGSCQDCKSVQSKRCRVLVIHEGKPRGIDDFAIILVNEPLGC